MDAATAASVDTMVVEEDMGEDMGDEMGDDMSDGYGGGYGSGPAAFPGGPGGPGFGGSGGRPPSPGAPGGPGAGSGGRPSLQEHPVDPVLADGRPPSPGAPGGPGAGGSTSLPRSTRRTRWWQQWSTSLSGALADLAKLKKPSDSAKGFPTTTKAAST